MGVDKGLVAEDVITLITGIAGQRLPDPQVRSIEDGLCAYTTFRSVLETELGAPVGVKVGFTSKPVQQSFGIDAPVAGALFAPMLLPDGARRSFSLASGKVSPHPAP